MSWRSCIGNFKITFQYLIIGFEMSIDHPLLVNYIILKNCDLLLDCIIGCGWCLEFMAWLDDSTWLFYLNSKRNIDSQYWRPIGPTNLQRTKPKIKSKKGQPKNVRLQGISQVLITYNLTKKKHYFTSNTFSASISPKTRFNRKKFIILNILKVMI